MINNNSQQSAMTMSAYGSLSVPTTPYGGAECLGIKKPNPAKRIEQLRKTEKIPQTIEIKPKAIETYGNGIGSRLNLWA